MKRPQNIYITQSEINQHEWAEPSKDEIWHENPFTQAFIQAIYDERETEEIELSYINVSAYELELELQEVDTGKEQHFEAKFTPEVKGVLEAFIRDFNVLPCHIRLIGDTYHFIEYLSTEV